MVSDLLNRTLAVHREQRTSDAGGGTTVARTQVGTVQAKVDQPSVAERTVAAQTNSEHSHNGYFLPDADVRRGDDLVGDGETFRVLATMHPSTPVYLRADLELTQSEV